MIPWANLLALVVLMTASFCAAASEIGFLAVGRLRARQLADDHPRVGKLLVRLLEHPSRLLATILVVITSLLYSIEALATKTSLDHGLPLWVPVVCMPVVVITLVEVTPVLYASQHPERVALAAARPVRALQLLLYPVVSLFTGVVNVLLRLLGLRPQSGLGVTEEEIKLAIEVAEEEGVLEEEESDLLTGVIEFHDKRVRELMVPRIDMVCVEADATVAEVLKIAVESHHSRVPVYRDSTDHIVGVVYVKDLIPHLGADSAEAVTAAEVAREAYFVPATRRVDALLEDLQQSRRSLALVHGEYGDIAGLVCMEDLLEEIVGEIVDEHDDERQEHQQLAEGIWLLDPLLTLRQIERLTDVDLLRQLPESTAARLGDLTEADTLSELLLLLYDRALQVGDQVRLRQAELTVEEVVGFRIERVRLQVNLPEVTTEEVTTTHASPAADR